MKIKTVAAAAAMALTTTTLSLAEDLPLKVGSPESMMINLSIGSQLGAANICKLTFSRAAIAAEAKRQGGDMAMINLLAIAAPDDPGFKENVDCEATKAWLDTIGALN